MESNTDKALESMKHGAGVAADYAGTTASKVASALRAKVAELAAQTPATSAADFLHSWRDTPTRAALVDFVERAVTEGGPGYLPPSDRIAVFDNDGTLWSEHPVYFQLQFAIDQYVELGKSGAVKKSDPLLKALAAHDLEGLAKAGEQGLLKLLAASHAGMTTDEFDGIVSSWMATARHPRFDRPYSECVYLPMLEALNYLRANGFKTFIVSGGGIDFMRVFAEQTYGVPPDQVVGSCGKTSYQVRDGVPVLVKEAEVDFIDDKEGKPVGIHRFIGRRPSIAFGNSDGDFAMLEYTTAGNGPRLALIVHHDDEEREYSYDRDAHFGSLARGLDEAEERGWVLISMKDDWSTIHRDA